MPFTPGCPYCHEPDAVFVRAEGLRARVTVYRCRKCHKEWAEATAGDDNAVDALRDGTGGR